MEPSEGRMSKNKTFLCRVCSKPLQEELDLLVRAIHSRPTTEDLVILHHSESQLVSLTEVLRDVLRETKVSGIVISSQGVENIMVALRDEERRGERVLKDVLDTVPLMIDDQACTNEFDPSVVQGSEECSIMKSDIEDIVIQSTQEYLLENGYQLPQHKLEDISFFKIGLDSLDLMMLAEKISERVEVDMELTALIDYPTVDALCSYINNLCDPMASKSNFERSLLPHTTSHGALGITGIQSNLPMCSKGDLNSFFEDGITQIPMKRWDMDRHGYTESLTGSALVLPVRFGAFLDDIEYFDPTIWDIPVIECEYMDPQQRLLLEAVSGLAFVMGADVVACGIFVGASTCDYQSLISKRLEVYTTTTPFSVTATGLGVIPGRIAFHLGMQGPAIATDTACSSSLVSLSIAHQMTQQEMIKSSFSCGTSLLIDQGQFQAFESANMLAKDGRSKALDASADGFARGEATVALRLDEIFADSCEILCVLKSIYVNQDGKSSRLTAPNGPAQTKLITETLRRSACIPTDVAKLMLHGTGTPLGDPIELGALLKSYQSSSADTTDSLLNVCAIKTSVGHSEAAAGIVSLSGAIAMRSMQTIPILHLRRINEHFERLMESYSDKGPCLSIKRYPAPSNADRTEKGSIGVSSFASQGTNCHAILSFGQNQSVQIQAESVLRAIWRKKCLWIFALPDTRIKFVHSSAKFTSTLFELPVHLSFPDSLQECFLAVALDAVSVLRSEKQTQEGGQGLQGIVYRDFIDGRSCFDIMRVQMEADVVTASIDGLQCSFADARLCRLFDLSQRAPGTKCLLMPSVKPSVSPSVLASKMNSSEFCYSHDVALLNWMEIAGCHKLRQGPPRLQSLSLCTCCESSGRNGYQTIHNKVSISSKGSLHGYRMGFQRDVPLHGDIYYTSNVLVNGCDREGKTDQSVSGRYYPLSLHNANYFVPLSIYGYYENFMASLEFLQQSMSYEKSRGRIGDPLTFASDLPLIYGRTRRDNTVAKFCDAVSHSFERETFNGKFAFWAHNGKTRTAYSSRSALPEEKESARHSRLYGSPVHCTPEIIHHHEHLSHQNNMASSPWMLSGGTGGLGWLLTTLCAVDHSPVVCVSKSGLLKQAKFSDIVSIKSDSAVSITRGEVNSREDISQIVSDATHMMRTCRFVHAGGLLHDSSHKNLSLETFRIMFAPKVSGIQCITNSLLINSNVQNLIAFSSIAALLHPSGSSLYGGINSIMDSLTSRLPATGVAAVSIQWGPWSSVGMVSKSSKVSNAMKAFGISMLSTQQGLWAFSTLISMKASPSLITVVPFDERQSRCGTTLHEVILSRIPSRRLPDVTRRQQPSNVDANSIIPKVQSLLSEIIGNRIDSHMESLIKYGADSLCAIEIQQQLSQEFRIELPASFLYDFPTVHSMSMAIYAMVSNTEAYCMATELETGLDEQKGRDPLCIKELAVREPDGLQEDQFDIECTKIANFFRWDVDSLEENVPEARFGKYLVDIDIFDSGIFGISTLEANLMDPQQRILLEDSLALRCRCTEAQGPAVGVVVGLSFWDYSKLSERHTESIGDALKLTGRNFSVSSGRISFVHGYSGPSMSIDTACSSSIVAVSAASNLLASEPLRSVIVGSVLISLSIDVMKFLASASMISPDGRCRTLDEGAAGYGRGEASVCMLITRSPDAPTAICAVTVNQDGHSASLTAPHGPSQIQVIRRACAKAAISPVDVGMHELHGTGTPLGDPIEIFGVSKAHDMASDSMTFPLCISTSKTAHGHSEPAAGCIGIHWIMRQLEKKIMAPNIHLVETNKHIASALLASKRAMYPARESRPMELLEPRALASLSSFAFQGTNAHAILQHNTSYESQCRADALRSMQAYHGQLSWYCSTVHPWMHPISPAFPDQDISWSIVYQQNFASRMKDHKVFGTTLLPGMCIFRIMSDAAQLCFAGRADHRHILRSASIGTPVHLEDAKNNLVAAISLSRGTATLCVENGNCSRPNAMCGISHLPSQGGAPINMDHRLLVLGTHARPPPSIPSIGYFAHTIDQRAEMTAVPSPELLDGSTHLAAFTESVKGRAVSVPVSSECLSITFSSIYTSNLDRFQGFVACDDVRASERLRDYHVHLPTTKYTYIKSLYSASLKRERSLGDASCFLNIDHINNIRKVDEISDLKHCQQAMRKLQTLQGSTILSSRRHENPSLEYSALIEFLSTQHGNSFTYLAPKMLGRSSSSRNRGQLQVAETEIGCTSNIVEHEPNAFKLHTVESWKEIAIPYSLNESEFGPSKKYKSLAAGITAVSGGTGGIGLLLGQWLALGEVEMHSCIALIGRRAFLKNSFPQMLSRNIPVTIAQHDCATETGANSMENVCRACNRGFRTNIFHGAGVLSDQTITSSSLRSSFNVFAPKYWGFKLTATRAGSCLAVGSIVALSSLSITIGNPGQSNYIAANSAMENASQNLAFAGIDSRIIRYGPWSNIGMLAKKESILKSLSKVGLLPLSPCQGLVATEAFIRSPHLFSTLGYINWDKINPEDPIESQMASYISDFEGYTHSAAIDNLSDARDRYDHLRSIILDIFVDVLDEVPPSDDDPFFEIGIDSISSIEIHRRLNQRLQKQLPPTILFDYPTVSKLAHALCGHQEIRVPHVIHANRDQENDHVVSICSTSQILPYIGMSMFEHFADFVPASTDLHSILPKDRWDFERHFSLSAGGTSAYTGVGAFVPNIWAFDQNFYGFKPNEARQTDPQLRSLLHTTANAINNGGTPGHLRDTGYGVFVGCMFYDYLRTIEGIVSGVDAAAIVGNGAPYLCGRIAYTFHMQGPCAGIDTACSSSLVAVDSAYHAIFNRKVRHSVACGTNVIISPGTTAMICQLGALSRYGRCLSLDAGADGYGRGEGVVSLILSSEHNASTLARIRATAVNQDGRSISMTAPNGPSQEALLRACLSKGGLTSDDLDQIVIHGTGTLLGDPIESQALQNLSQGTHATPTHIAAVKALLGHCEGAAGTVGVLLCVYAACRKSTASIQTLRVMNPLVQNTIKSGKLIPSREHAPEYATIAGETLSGSSSFGMSGTNAHAIVSGTQISMPSRQHDTLSKSNMYSFRIFVSESLQFLGHKAQHATCLFEYDTPSSTVHLMMDHQVKGRSIMPASLQIYTSFQTLLQTTTTKGEWSMNNFVFHRPSNMKHNLQLLIRHNFAEGSLAILDRASGDLKFSSARVEFLCCHTGWASQVQASRSIQSLMKRDNVTPKISDKYIALISAVGQQVAPILDASFHLGAIRHTDCRIPISCGSIHIGIDPSINTMKAHIFSSAESTTEYQHQSMYYGSARGDNIKSREMKVKRAHGDVMQQESIWMSTPGFEVFQPGVRIDQASMPFYQGCAPEPIRLVATSLEMLYGGIATNEDDSIYLSYPFPSHHRQKNPLGACLQRVYLSEARQGLAEHLTREVTSRQRGPLENVPVQSPLQHSILGETSRSPNTYAGTILSSLGGIGTLLARYFSTSGSNVRSCSRLGVTGSLPLDRGIEIVKADVSYAEDAKFLLSDTMVGYDGIMHTSGSLRDGLIRSIHLEGLRATLASKRNSFDLISNYSYGSPWITLCAFSSIASPFGSIGQAAYAAANQAMDAEVCQCSGSGLPAHSIQWGLWGGVGMARGLQGAALKRLSSIGVLSVTPIEGLERLEAILRLQEKQHISVSMVCKIHNDLLEKYLASQPQVRHLLRGIKSKQSAGSEEHVWKPGQTNNASQHVENIPQTLKVLLCQHLDRGGDDLDLSAPVLQLGFDSVSSVELLQSLEKGFRVNFPATFMYDYVYFDDMVAYIKAKLHVDELAQGPAIKNTHISQTSKGAQIVCTASLFAGSNGSQGTKVSFKDDCAGPSLHNFSEVQSCAFASTISRKDIFAFDSELFKLPKTTVLGLDPNIRWMLTLTKELFGGKGAVQRNCGVYLGWMWSHENFDRLRQNGYASEYLASSVTGNSAAFAVGYISYLFELNGPSIPIDTACSSSLVALHTANQGMHSSDCIDAVILGANSFLEDHTWNKIEALKALSPDGRCKTFDASADGYGRGEAFTSMHMTSSVHNDTAAIVIGTAINTIGTRSSLTAPHGPSQIDVIRQAQARCGNVTVSGLFLHGTGTSLGDPIEIRALQQALKGPGERGLVAFQSPKSSVGHTEGSAGLTNILAALSAMQSKLLMPIHNLRSLNPMISLTSGTASVTRTLCPHPCETPAYSGSNSFGMTGVNSHAILQHSTGAADHPSSREVEMDWMSPAVGWTQYILCTRGSNAEFQILPNIAMKSSSLRDHYVNHQHLLPGTLFIELAKEALALLSQSGLKPFSNISWNIGCLVSDLPSITLTVEDERRINVSKSGVRCACTMDCAQPLTSNAGANTKVASSPWPVLFSCTASNTESYIANTSHESQLHDHPLGMSLPMDAMLHLGAINSTALHVPVAMEFFLDRTALSPPSYISTKPSNTETRKSTGELSLGVIANTVSIVSHSLVGKEVIQGKKKAVRKSTEQMYVQTHDASVPAPREWENPQAPPGNTFVIDGRVKMLPVRHALHSVVDAFQQSMSILQGSIGHHIHHAGSRERSLSLHRPKDEGDTAVQEATIQTFSKEQLGSAVVTRYSDLGARRTSLDPGTVAHESYQLQDGRVKYKPSFIVRDWLQRTYFPDQLLDDAMGAMGGSRIEASLGKNPGISSADKKVSVIVTAVGLNFRDLLMALGMYPSKSTKMGSDFAGFVSSSDFSDFARGDPIFGQTIGTFQSEIKVDPCTVSHIPPTISHEEASGMPTIYLTAMTCLKCLPSMSTGDGILVQSAAGGFGIAMAEMARASGMSVVATASTPMRRHILRAQGSHAFNSRNTEFVEDIMTLPSLAVKSVVNTLTSQGMIAASCSLLHMGGTFVEVSKRDIFSIHRMLQERSDISHHTVAVDLMSPEALRRDLRRISKLIGLGEIRPCPCTAMPLTHLRQALLRFKSPNNIGKIIWRNQRDESMSGTWLVTGGLGALGMLTVSLLVSRGCDIAIPTRTGKPCPATLREARGSISMQTGSISQPETLREYFKRSRKSIDGIVHSSGILHDALFLHQNLGKAREVFAAKTSTIDILQNIAGSESLSAIVLFSSMSSVFGNVGQANYCSANKVLDISSQKFGQAGHSSFVINWGPWAGGGMAANLNASVLESAGLSLIDPKYGTHMIHHFLSTRLKSRLSCYVCASSRTELDEQLAASKTGRHNDARNPDSSSANRQTTFLSREYIERDILSILSALLEGELDPSAPLMASGLDSLGSIQLVTTLSKTFAIEISSTFPFDNPTIQSMADQIFAMKCPDMRASTTDHSDTNSHGISPQSAGGLSIVGVYSLLPEVESHGDAAREVPFNRWDGDVTKTNFKFSNFIQFGGFLPAIWETFDISLFRMSMGEAKIIDPQQRCLLEGVVSCSSGQQSGRDACVAVGIARLEDPWETIYSTHNLILQGNGTVSTSRAASAAAGRVSYTFDYKGPSLSIDTACSSSLVALKVIEDIFAQNDSTEGFLCGVSLPMSARTSMMLASSSMLARDGRCKTLDASADGYGRSEACLVMKLKPRQLDAPESLGVFPHGVIVSSAVNQDGASASLTAPHGPSQEQVLHKGLSNGSITPMQVRVAGMHGTGTPLGDPIEISSIQQKLSTGSLPLTLASSKARYGHAETASGVLGLLYIVGMANHSSKQKIVNLRHLNPHMTAAFNKGTLHAPRESEPCVLHQAQTRISSISAFAFQGTNACAFVDREPGYTFDTSNNGMNLLSQPTDLVGPKCHRLVSSIFVNKDQESSFICRNAAPTLRLMDHVVNGRPTLPAAGFIHLVQTAVDSLRNDGHVALLRNLNFQKVKLLSTRNTVDMVVKVCAGRVAIHEERAEAITELCSAQITRFNKGSMWWALGTLISKTRVGGINRGNSPYASSYGLTDTRCAELTHTVDSNWHLLVASHSTSEDLYIPSTIDMFQQDVGSAAHHRIAHANLRQLPYPSSHEVKHISSAVRHGQGGGLHNQAHSMALRRIHQTKHAKSRPPLLSMETQVTRPVYESLPQTNTSTLMIASKGTAADLSAEMCTILQAFQVHGYKALSSTTFSSDPTTDGHICRKRKADRVNSAVFGSIKELSGFENPLYNEPTTRAMIDRSEDSEHNRPILTHSKFNVIITGGAGGIGTAVQQWLSFQEISTTSFSRRGYGKAIPRLSRTRTRILIHLSMKDVGEPDTGCIGEHFPGHYKMHAAGVLHDQLIRDIRIDKFRQVFSPKYYGSIRQTENGERLGVGGYLLFGSIAAVLGNVGQTSYILANSALENVALRLSNGGISTSVIHWGPWQIKQGMVTPQVQKSLLQQGVTMLSPLDGLGILQNLLIENTYTARQGHHIYCGINLSEHIDRKEQEIVGVEGRDPAITGQLAGTAIMATVIQIATSLIAGSTDDLTESSRFVDHGLSSLLTAEFAEALNSEFHVGVTSTVVFDYPTVKDLSDFIAAETSRRQRNTVSPAKVASLTATQVTSKIQRRIEIVASAHRYPAHDMKGVIETVWAEADDFQDATPASRWNVDDHFSPASAVGKMYVRFGCWLERIDHFEGHFFGLTPQESLTLDPQIRILMELSQEVRSNMSLHPDTSNFVGVMYNEYLDAVLGPTSLADEVSSSITTNGMSFMVGRISYHHKVRGKAAAIDTACSSSLVAAHLGYLSAAEGNGTHSLAHGINLMLSPQTTARICLIKALSSVGRCKTADSAADGYGRSESGCTICMAPSSLEDCLEVLGSSVSHNGASGGLTAPHGRSQANLILSVQSQSLNHATPAVVSLHGTGTVLGDPIEFGALKTVLAESLPKETKPVYQQSLVATKSAMGHTEGNAGLCGLMLPLSNIQRRFLSPIKHLRYINSYIETLQGENPHRFVRQAAPNVCEEVGRKATYCTNSFGMSGVNAHMMCEVPISGQVGQDTPLLSTQTLPWQRTRSWPLPPTGMFPLAHVAAETQPLTFSADLKQQRLCWIQDHIVGNQSILPGSVSLSMFSQALHSISFGRGEHHAISNVAFVRPAFLTSSSYAIQIEGRNIVFRDHRRAVTVSATISGVAGRVPEYDRLPKRGHVLRFQVPATGPEYATSLAVSGIPNACAACTLDAAMHLALATWPTGKGGEVPVQLSLHHCISGPKDSFISSHKNFGDNRVDAQTKDRSIQGLQSSMVTLLAEDSQQRSPAPALYTGDYLVDTVWIAHTPVSSTDSCILTGENSTEMRFIEWYAPLEVARLDGIWQSRAVTFVIGGTEHRHLKNHAMRSLASSLAKVVSTEVSNSTVACLELPSLSALPRLPADELPVGRGNAMVQGRFMATPWYKSYSRQKTTTYHPSIGDQNFGDTAIVTGAFGGIGTLVSEWLASRGQYLIRAGRGMPDRSSLNALESSSLQTCVKCDTRFASDLPQLREAPSSRLQGMHHTSGVLKDKLLFRVKLGDLLHTAGPKCATLDFMLDQANLHRAQYALGYSSISSIIGNAGQLAYTFANRQLNAVCCKKRECGMDVTAIAWGPWSGIGMAASAGLSADSFSNGMKWISPQEGLALLADILGPARSAGTIIAGAYHEDLFMASAPSPSRDEVLEIKHDTPTVEDEGTSGRFSTLEDVTLYVTHTIERLLGAPVGMTDNIVGELDSLQSVSAADQLSAALQMEVSPTVLYDYPRLQDLAHHLGSLYITRAGSRSAPSTRGSDPSLQIRHVRRNTGAPGPLTTVTAIVPELSPTQNRRSSLPAGYYCWPAIDHIMALSPEDLASIENFVVGREGIGEIRFLYPVDLTKVDLHNSVTISRAGMAIAGTASKEPGQGLNQPAILVFRGGSKRIFRSQNARRLLMSKLRAACDRMGATLVHVDEDAAEWMVKIDCFNIG